MWQGTIPSSHPALRQKLYPTSPSRSPFYDERSYPVDKVEPGCGEKPLHAIDSLPSSSAPHDATIDGWEAHTHPEGERYYTRGASPRVITEADVTDTAISKAVNAWVQGILDLSAKLDLVIGHSIDLFVEPSATSGLCGYYFADHDSRTIFWLEGAPTSKLGLSQGCSDQTLMLALEKNYWKHVELFCMRPENLSGGLEELITNHLNGYGRADMVTTPTETFDVTPEGILVRRLSVPCAQYAANNSESEAFAQKSSYHEELKLTLTSPSQQTDEGDISSITVPSVCPDSALPVKATTMTDIGNWLVETCFPQLHPAQHGSQLETARVKVTSEWQYIQSTLLVVAAADAAGYAVSTGTDLKIDQPAFRCLILSAITAAFGLCLLIGLNVRYLNADSGSFAVLARNTFDSSYSYFAITSRLPLLAMWTSLLTFSLFLLIVALSAIDVPLS
ncbi:unnamed protein product [Peniophora sp. CBMAI 1063]|nr:unnamed protein product [Peniophora sp. CBMAI 1063]